MTDFSECFWKGKPFPELTRDELYEIIVHLAAGTETQRECYEAELNRLRGTVFSMQLADKLFKGPTETVN